MNFKMGFLATVSVALFAISANAEVIHESDFEAEPATGFGIGPATMGFADAGGDLIGFSANNNPLMTGDALGISAANPNSGSFSYAVDAGATTPAGNGWGGSWCGQNTEGGSGGFTDQVTAETNGAGCYVDFSEGATFTLSAMVATDALDPLTGTAAAEIRLEFTDGVTPDVIPRAVTAPLGAADLTVAYQPVTISYTLTAADVALGINSVTAVVGSNGHGDGATDGMIYYDDFVFEVDSAHVVIVGDGHVTAPLLGDVNLDGEVTFLDIAPFIALLSTQGFQAEADIDLDLSVTFLDIQPFIDILAGN